MDKRIIIFLAVLALAVSACSAMNLVVNSNNIVEGSGTIITENRSVGEFSAIQLVGSADITVRFGEEYALSIEGDDNIVPLTETVVQSNTLIIRQKSNTSIRPTVPVKIELVVKELEGLNINGSGNIAVDGFDKPALKIELPGSGNITVIGSTDQLTIHMSGSGNILCDQLRAENVIVDLSGSGNIDVYASVALRASVDGSGNIFYSGNPAEVSKNVNGSGSIQQR